MFWNTSRGAKRLAKKPSPSNLIMVEKIGLNLSNSFMTWEREKVASYNPQQNEVAKRMSCTIPDKIRAWPMLICLKDFGLRY